MVIVPHSVWQGSRADLQRKVNAYKAALDAHATTVGVPAPFPEMEILREIVRDPQGFQLEGAPATLPDNKNVLQELNDRIAALEATATSLTTRVNDADVKLVDIETRVDAVERRP